MNHETKLTEYLTDLYGPRKLLGVVPATVVKYEIAIRHLHRHLARAPTIGDLNDDVVSGCLAGLLEHGCGAATVNGYLAKLVCMNSFAVKQRLVVDYLDIPKLTELRREPEALSEATFSAVMRAAESAPGDVGDVPAELWWTSLLLSLYDSAARISAMMSVQWSDVDLDGGSLLIRAEKQKQKSDQRHVLHPETLALLSKLRDITGGGGSVWPWPYSRLYLWQKFRTQIAKPAGLPDNRRFRFHSIRRTSLTIIASKLGLDAACRMADHSSAAVTKRSYVDPTRMGGRRPIDVLPRPGKARFAGWFGWLRGR